ncbi:MAG: MFS transporter [Gemmatimonadetes bacterium]|nr:MFS transporter [Gemmatimonadota bacterium]MYB61207.1 MFS transporter [Gemmatimonadota bacterium]
MTEKSREGNNRLIVVLFGLMFVAVADNQMISPLLPDLMAAFGMGAGRAGLLVSVYAIAAAVVSFAIGPLSDRTGRRRMLIAALILFTAATLLCGLAWDYASLVAFRAVTGAAAGALSLNITACIGDHFPYRRRGAAMGLVMSGYFAAMILGVPAGAFVAEAWSWRWAFGVFAGAGLLLWAPALAVLPHRVPAVSMARKVSLGGTGSAGGADGAYGEVHAVSAVSAARAVSINNLARSYGRFLGRTGPLAVVAASFLVSASTVGFITYVGTWLREAYGLSTDWIGLIFLFSGLGALVGSPLAGYISDRAGKRGVVVVSGLVMAGLLATIPWVIGLLPVVFGGFILTGIAGAFRHAPLQALVTAMASDEERGTLIALKNTVAEFGIAGGTALCGVLYVAFGYPSVGAACGVMAAAASFVILIWVREPGETGETGEPGQT